MPALGDPAHLDDLWPGLNVRSGFHVVIGTDSDQTAVSAGELKRTWEANGRRYFEYGLDGPVWPSVSLLSARYAVTRDEWNGVKLEIYNDPRHAWNVPTMIETMKKAMAYYSREFGAYPLPYFRMAAYPRYKTQRPGRCRPHRLLGNLRLHDRPAQWAGPRLRRRCMSWRTSGGAMSTARACRAARCSTKAWRSTRPS